MKKLFALLLVVVVLPACKNESNTATSSATETASVSRPALSPEQLGELGAKIQNNPNDAQKILSDNGLTEESFEQAVRKVSEDPAASKRYADAFRKAAS